MKISVVIAYHDEKQYIKDCLASLAEQTFQDFEVILVCDGCEAPEEGIPETLNIVTVMQEEKGVAGARNAGIEKTQGEYVVFLDADDYLAEDTLEALAESRTGNGSLHFQNRDMVQPQGVSGQWGKIRRTK